jgi:hypothetical protein
MIPPSLYEYTGKVFMENLSQINEDILKSKYPKSLKVMLRGIMKIDEILKSMTATKSSFYTSQILARVLFEHSLVFQYIFIKFNEDLSDNVGEDYYSNYFMSEFVKRENYEFGIDNIRNNTKEPITIERIQKKYPSVKDLNLHSINKIHTSANQFDVRKIGDYLNNKINNKNNFKAVHEQMLEFLSRYNKLSSFVHGGPSSELNSYEIKVEEHNRTIEDNLLIAQIASYSAKHNIISTLYREFPSAYIQLYTDLSMAILKYV